MQARGTLPAAHRLMITGIAVRGRRFRCTSRSRSIAWWRIEGAPVKLLANGAVLLDGDCRST